MDTYSTVNGDYQLFEDKMPIETETNDMPSQQEMIKYMFKILVEYSRSINAGEEPAVDPLNGRVTMRLNNGKVIDIPEEIQRFAIAQYVRAAHAGDPRVQTAVQPQRRVIVEEDNSDKKDKTMMNILIIVLIIVVVYLLYKYFNRNEFEY